MVTEFMPLSETRIPALIKRAAADSGASEPMKSIAVSIASALADVVDVGLTAAQQ